MNVREWGSGYGVSPGNESYSKGNMVTDTVIVLYGDKWEPHL